MKSTFCQACSFARDGVKTRKAIPHTCGGNQFHERPKYEKVPTREELERYLDRLKWLMNENHTTHTS